MSMDTNKRNRDVISSPDTPEKEEKNSRVIRQKLEDGGHTSISHIPVSTQAYPETDLFAKGVTMTEQGDTTSTNNNNVTEKQSNPINNLEWLCESFKSFKEDVSKKLDKLDKIDNILCRVDQLQENISKQSDKISHLAEENGSLKAEIRQLDVYKQRVIDLEIYTKRNNLIFDGVKQSSEKESYMDSEIKFHNILDKLNIHNPTNIDVETVHRLGKKFPGKPQPLIVRFVKFSDRQMVWSKRFGLKGSGIWLREHFPANIEAERQVLKPYYKAALERGLNPNMTKNILQVDHKNYTVKNLMDLPEPIGVKETSLKQDEGAVYFSDKTHPFSNQFPVEIVIDGIKFNCAEQFINFRKAQIHGDKDTAEAVLKAELPAEQMRLTKHLSQSEEWNQLRDVVMKVALSCKFEKDTFLAELLLFTEDATLVYCSPDKYWGIGSKLPDAKKTASHAWKGKNQLGVLLTEVRYLLEML